MPADRRASPRRVYTGGRLPPAARIRPGSPVTVVNLSARGTLVEAALRLRPGGRCEFQFTTRDGEVIAAARIVRCFVARLDASSIRYRTALVFEPPVSLPDEHELLAGYQLPAVWPHGRPARVSTTPRLADRAASPGTGPPLRRDGRS